MYALILASRTNFESLCSVGNCHGSKVGSKARYKVSPGRPIPIPDFNELQPDMVLFKRGVPTERHPSPNEIYLVVQMSETTLKQDEGKKLLAYQVLEFRSIGLSTSRARSSGYTG